MFMPQSEKTILGTDGRRVDGVCYSVLPSSIGQKSSELSAVVFTICCLNGDLKLDRKTKHFSPGDEERKSDGATSFRAFRVWPVAMLAGSHE